jgi:glycosyltransferase involved in cell wall biosynthesis
MKLCFIWPYYGPQYEDRVQICLSALQPLHSVYAIALSRACTTYSFWQSTCSNVYFCLDEAWENSPPADAFKKVFERLVELSPDVVFTHSYSTIDARASILYALTYRKRWCIMSDSNECDYPRHPAVERIKGLIIQGADAMLLSSVVSCKYYRKLGFRLPIHLGYNAISAKRISSNCDLVNIEYAARPGRDYLICIARPLQKKNIHRLVLAWAESGVHSHFDLVLVGATRIDYDLHTIPDSVHCMGALPPSAALSLIKRSRGLILPSISEQFGNVVAEAICLGIPVLVSDRVGSLEVALLYRSSFVFNPFDTSSIADAIANWAHLVLAGRATLPDDSKQHAFNSSELLPPSINLVDFATSVYTVAGDTMRAKFLDRLISLLLVQLMHFLYRRKNCIDLNLDVEIS